MPRGERQRGRIITVIAKKRRVIVEGARMIKEHMRKSQQYPEGQLVEREGSVYFSNCDEGRDTTLEPRGMQRRLQRRPKHDMLSDLDPDHHLRDAPA